MVVKRKGISYYLDPKDADIVVESLRFHHPGVRAVPYDLGWAVQYRISGPYYPELETLGRGRA